MTEEKGSGAILRTAPEIGAQASLESGSEGPWRASDEGTFKAKRHDPALSGPCWTAAQGLSAAGDYTGKSYNL